VNQLICGLATVLYYAVYAYTAVLLIYAIVSWFPSLRGRWTSVLAALVEPVLIPIRRIIPPVGGLDLAFLIVLLVLQLLVRPALASLANSCILGP
jgi:YggT family protein